jgi:hypothetical protein
MLASTVASIMMILGAHQYVAIVGAALIDGAKGRLVQKVSALSQEVGELRDDQSNRHYFYLDSIGVYRSSQPTDGVG